MVCNEKTLVKIDELPEFNGECVDSIYAEYENSRYEGGAYVADILFYRCYTYFDRKKRYFMVKELPREFDGLFGLVSNGGKTVFVTSLWLRTSDSCNGSFVDETMRLSGWASNATQDSLPMFRGDKHMSGDRIIDEKGELGKRILGFFGKKFKVKECEFADVGAKMEEGSLDFATKYPYKHTPIRLVDRLVYPDEKLDSWRFWHGMPYMVPKGAVEWGGPDDRWVKRIDRRHIRVLDEVEGYHLYMGRADDMYVGEEGLVSVEFRDYKSHDVHVIEGWAYCNIVRYNESCNNVFKTYKITAKKGDRLSFTHYRGMTVMGHGECRQGDLYRINKRMPMDTSAR